MWAAGRVGAGITPWIVTPIMQMWDWRAAFWIIGSIGFVWALVWWLWYRDEYAMSAMRCHHEGLFPVAEAEISAEVLIPWRRILRSKQLWLISAMYALYVWGSWFYFSWLHTFLIRGRGFTEAEASSVSSLPFFMGACGNLAGGMLSDRLVRAYGLRNGRRWVGSASLALSSSLFLATALTQDKWQAIALLAVGLFVLDFLVPTAWAVCLDVSPRHAGAVSAVMSTAGQAGGFVCTVLFGYLASSTGSYDVPLLAISAMVMLSATLFWFIDASQELT